MLRVTTPVTANASACRGEATRRAPKRSASYTGENAPDNSTSQPLHEPASTWRTCSDPAIPVGGDTAGAGFAAAGSTTRPMRRILPTHPIYMFLSIERGSADPAGGRARTGLQVLEQSDLLVEQ